MTKVKTDAQLLAWLNYTKAQMKQWEKMAEKAYAEAKTRGLV